MTKKQQPRCVVRWLADPADCWLREGCRYWSKVEQRCKYVEIHEAEKAGVAGPGVDAANIREREGS